MKKAPPIKIQPLPKMDVLWTRLHLQYVGLLNGHCYLIIVDNFSKWSEIFKCRHIQPVDDPTVEPTTSEKHCKREVLNTVGLQIISRDTPSCDAKLSGTPFF